jgi:hypothetical protein
MKYNYSPNYEIQLLKNKNRKKNKNNNLSMAIHGLREVPMLLHIFKAMEVQPLDHHTCSMAVGVFHGAPS